MAGDAGKRVRLARLAMTCSEWRWNARDAVAAAHAARVAGYGDMQEKGEDTEGG